MPTRLALAPVPPLLLTRPRAASERFAEAWRAAAGAGAVVLIAPVTEIVPLPGAPDPSGYSGVVFASQNAVAALGAPARPVPAWCVGTRTAAAARAAGWAAEAAEGDADALVAMVAAAGARGPLLFARGRESHGEVAARLRAAGIACDEAVVYDQRPAPLGPEARALLGGTATVLVPLFSAGSARRLAAALAGLRVRAPLRVAALSGAVAEAWSGPAPDRLAVAGAPDAEAMIRALLTLAAPP
ncbi:MAG: uroporphyrinogen-III synthase [Rhodobacteraceae bacterium]|nr:uroporphyrinogen-III synthase [Paracoccaceae bacterium]